MLEHVKRFWWIGAIVLAVILTYVFGAPWEAFVIVAGFAALAIGVWFFKFWMKRGEWAHEVNFYMVMAGIDTKVLANFKHDLLTPGGVRVKSTVPVPQNALELIDQGISKQIELHSRAYPNWTLFKNLSDYDVLLINPMGINEVNEPGAPHIKVNGWSTAGTIAWSTTMENVRVRPPIIVPHQAGQDWRYTDYFYRSIWHEAEHVREWVNLHNEPTGVFYFWAGTSDVHPHVPDTNAPVGLVSRSVASAPECALFSNHPKREDKNAN